MEHDKTYFLDILNRTIDQASRPPSSWMWLMSLMLVGGDDDDDSSESLCIIEAPEAGGDFLICQLAMCF